MRAGVTLRGPAAGTHRGQVRVLQAAFGILLAARIVVAFRLPVIGDEAYYWLWGQHPDLSYFDHAPLLAWLQGLVSMAFGWNVFSLRLVGWLTTAATVWLLYLWTRKLHGDDWEPMFWIGTVAHFASPLFFAFSAMMFMDQLLIPLVLGSVLCFVRFFDGWERDVPRWGQLYLAATLLGLAGLTKYNAVFVGAGVILYVLSGASRRRLLLRHEIYFAGCITLALLSPIVVWNLQHDFASMGYNLVDRNAGLAAPSLGRVRTFLFQTLLYLSPFLVWPLAKAMFVAKPASSFALVTRDLGRLIFVCSTAVFVVVASGGGSGAYWNIVAYVPLVPLLAGAIGAGVQLILHYLLGLLLIGVLCFTYMVTPIEVYFGGYNWETAVVHGWDQIKAEVAAVEEQYDPDFLAATRYTLAAQLAFARGRDDVTALSARVDQFDLWWQPKAHIGQTAIILADDQHPIDAGTTAQFQSIEKVRTFDVVRAATVINTYHLFLAKGYIAPAS